MTVVGILVYALYTQYRQAQRRKIFSGLVHTSLKSDQEIFLAPFALPDSGHLHWENYRGDKRMKLFLRVSPVS